jgi:hypothetical protein
MPVLIAQFKITPESTQQFEAASEKTLAALSTEQPEGVHYTWCRLSGSHNFMGWLELDVVGPHRPIRGERLQFSRVTEEGR